MAIEERLTREEALDILTMARDLMLDAQTKDQAFDILAQTGDKVGYTPAFRCLVKGMEPEVAIRWGK